MAIQGFAERLPDGAWRVGASDQSDGYSGPVADVRAVGAWLYVTTGPYEGNVMLNVEVLDTLIEVLCVIRDERNKAGTIS